MASKFDRSRKDRWKKHRKYGSKDENLSTLGSGKYERTKYWEEHREEILENRRRMRENSNKE